MKIPKRYFRLTGSLVKLAKQHRKACDAWHDRVSGIVTAWDTDIYLVDHIGIVGIGCIGDAPVGWLAAIGNPGYMVPDRRTHTGREYADYLADMPTPQPTIFRRAIRDPQIIPQPHPKRPIRFKADLHHVDGQYYAEVLDAPGWHGHAALLEIAEADFERLMVEKGKE